MLLNGFPPSIQSLSDYKHRKQKETQLLTERWDCGHAVEQALFLHISHKFHHFLDASHNQRITPGIKSRSPKLAHPDLRHVDSYQVNFIQKQQWDFKQKWIVYKIKKQNAIGP